MGLVRFIKSKLRRKARAVAVLQEETGCLDDHPKKSCSSDGVLRLSWNDVERATWGFSVAIGYGGFSHVYLAEFQGPSMAAVKVLHGCTQRLLQAFRQELEILRRVGRHDHIVELLGYCDDREEGVLIFQYVGSTLQDKLHGSNAVLSWRARVSVAFQLAQAMAYLHDSCSPHIVHGDIKPSNILLDDGLNCKLCDFGSAKMGFSSSVIPNSSRGMMVGSPGYTDPLYIKTGIASKKNDVYSFGVVLLELVTGMEAISAKSGKRLTTQAEPMTSGGNVAEIVDPCIRGEVEMEEVRAMVVLAKLCLSEHPNIRPSALDIVSILKNRIPSLSFSCSSKNST